MHLILQSTSTSKWKSRNQNEETTDELPLVGKLKNLNSNLATIEVCTNIVYNTYHMHALTMSIILINKLLQIHCNYRNGQQLCNRCKQKYQIVLKEFISWSHKSKSLKKTYSIFRYAICAFRTSLHIILSGC